MLKMLYVCSIKNSAKVEFVPYIKINNQAGDAAQWWSSAQQAQGDKSISSSSVSI